MQPRRRTVWRQYRPDPYACRNDSDTHSRQSEPLVALGDGTTQSDGHPSARTNDCRCLGVLLILLALSSACLTTPTMVESESDDTWLGSGTFTLGEPNVINFTPGPQTEDGFPLEATLEGNRITLVLDADSGSSVFRL